MAVLTPPASRAAPATDGEQLAPRDRFVDAVRALGTVAVIGVHWLMPEATWDGARLAVGNALGHGSGWLLTWALQVLALLFFASGASAASRRQRRPQERHGSVLLARLHRLLPPVLTFGAAWALALAVLPRIGVPAAALEPAARIAPQLLWFLGVDLVLLVLLPLLLQVQRRWPRACLVAAAAVPLMLDLARFAGGAAQPAALNVIAVWVVPYLLGIAYARRRREPAPALLVGALLVGLAGAVALVALGPYPASMIGMPGDDISNLGPPTAPVLALGVAQVCLVLLLRRPLLRWSSSGSAAGVLDWVCARSMTLYLWHLTAMLVVVGVVLVGEGLPWPAPWSLGWWLLLPASFAAYAAVLGIFVTIFGRVERVRRSLDVRG